MKRYKVTLNGFKLNVIEAKDEQQALEIASYLYGIEIDIKEI